MATAIEIVTMIETESMGCAMWFSACGVREVEGIVTRIEHWLDKATEKIKGLVLVTTGGKVYWPHTDDVVVREVVELWGQRVAA